MLNWVRWWGLAVFAIVFIALLSVWFLLAPWLVKNAIEEIGSETIGAVVEVDSVSLALFPPTIIISKLQVADPDAPMKNLFETEKIQIAVESQPLLWKKIIIDDLTLGQLKLGTARTTSGVLPNGRKTAKIINSIKSTSLTGIKNINLGKLVAKADLITTRRINNLDKMQSEKQLYWEKILNNKNMAGDLKLINDEFDVLQKRLKRNKFNLFKDRKKWKKLKRNISQLRKKYKQLIQRLSLDKQAIQKQIASVRQGPKDDLEKLMSQTGLGGAGIKNLSNRFLGPKITPWVLKVLKVFKGMDVKSTSGNALIEKGEENNRNFGRKIVFKDEQKLPDILIKQINIDGGNSSWSLKGQGSNFACPPWRWQQPAILKVLLSRKSVINTTSKTPIDLPAAGVKLDLTSKWKTEKIMRTNMQIVIDNWQLDGMPLMQVNDKLWTLRKGRLSAKLLGELTFENIDLRLSFVVSSPSLQYPGNLQNWQKQLAETINQQQQIAVNVTLTGSLNKPEITIDSDLENIFQNMFKLRFQKETAKIKIQLQKAISKKVGGLSKINNLDTQFGQWQKKLVTEDNGLNKILSGIKL